MQTQLHCGRICAPLGRTCGVRLGLLPTSTELILKKNQKARLPNRRSPSDLEPTRQTPPPDPPGRSVTGRSLTMTKIEQHIEQYEGPLPPPHLLRQFEDIVPGAAERIMANADLQTMHRIEMERIVIRGSNFRATFGIVAGLIVALSFLAGSVYLSINGAVVPGTILGTVDLTALVLAFIYGTNARQHERIEKSRIMSGHPSNPPRK